LILLALGLSVGGIALYVRGLAEGRWTEMKAKIREMIREDLALSGARPPLRGEGEPGNAWDDYELVFPSEHTNLQGEQDLLENFLETGEDREKVEEVLASHVAVLKHLRSGVNRRVAKYAYRTETAWIPKPYSFLATRWVGYLGLGQSALLARQGRTREAAEWALDTMQYAEDLSISFAWAEMLDMSEYLLEDTIRLKAMEARGFLEIAKELKLLDESFARPHTTRWVVGRVNRLIDLEEEKSPQARNSDAEILRAGFWTRGRYAFSTRLMIVRSFDDLVEANEALARVASAPWTEERRIVTELKARYRHGSNPLSRSILAYADEDLASRPRRSLARLRLLRIAAHYRATGEVLDLPDPFGDRLKHRVEGSRLQAWSIGAKQVDRDGAGDFSEPGDRNIVIEVER
jgi:hypothetical protein